MGGGVIERLYQQSTHSWLSGDSNHGHRTPTKPLSKGTGKYTILTGYGPTLLG